MKRQGLALLLVVGILGILAILASAFVTLARLERRASLQRLHATQALLLARSGIEDALARLSAGQEASYAVEDWNGDGTLNPGVELAGQVYAPSTLDTAACPFRHALRPSFYVRGSSGQPDLVPVDGRMRGHTGALLQGSYALKVEDESAKINVNGGFLDAQDRDANGIPNHRDPFVSAGTLSPPIPADADRGWNAKLLRILNTLGQQPEIGILALSTILTGYGRQALPWPGPSTGPRRWPSRRESFKHPSNGPFSPSF